MSQAPEFARANPQKGDCVDSSSESDSPLSDGGAAIVAEGTKPASLQEKNAATDLAKRKRKQDAEFKNKLDHIAKNPKLWQSEENRYLREFFNYIDVNRSTYPFSSGDRYDDLSAEPGNGQRKLTQGYIKAIAAYQDTSFVDHPIFYVLECNTIHQDEAFTGFSEKKSPPTKILHLLLADGDGNQMTGRLSSQISDQGKQLKKGVIIRLDLYTELTHHINDHTSRMPFVFILKYSPMDYKGTLPVDKLHDLIPCSNSLPNHYLPPLDNETSTADISDEPVDCCPSNRYCSMHGVSFAVCICQAIPIAKLDLASIKEDCYFATENLDKMTNPHKRNMIYWWYATNIYSICGKKKRKQLPKCLVHNIRRCHPSDEYSGYEQSCNRR